MSQPNRSQRFTIWFNPKTEICHLDFRQPVTFPEFEEALEVTLDLYSAYGTGKVLIDVSRMGSLQEQFCKTLAGTFTPNLWDITYAETLRIAVSTDPHQHDRAQRFLLAHALPQQVSLHCYPTYREALRQLDQVLQPV